MIDPDKVYHVLPIDDLEEHINKCEFSPIGLPVCRCKCKPTYIEENEGFIVVHNSFDGREGVEWVNEILKPTDS